MEMDAECRMQNAGCNKYMHSSVIQHKQDLVPRAGWNGLLFPLYAKPSTSMAGWGSQLPRLLGNRYYYYGSFCLACISPLQLIRPHATQDSLRSKRTKGRKRTRFASALHPSTRRAIHPYPSRSSNDSSEPLPRGTLCGRFSSQLMVSAPSPLGPIHARGEACACRSLASFFPVALHQPHAAAACVHRACRLLAVSCSCKLTS
ncbi:hypothetical protein M441DRAFT_405034 [Trichoderma asperellum CBS 433.97]|uniref:Uncharacterized protein n=1 Tax=Trichoderma asperellum (strain ATCC 204424 / CBS 433.97 / NBRC 101777) TaxID=1042311 RepID=A0A2T3ZAI7_TRIA4|nr:hypothetical protein M441DRAFT_405034 [Trichoderma asperellum CBS 433.97]PTB41817.1 hypothetical protein M441DRAFT_405034 [Trichoderma asperellum CBS 433.97]